MANLALPGPAASEGPDPNAGLRLRSRRFPFLAMAEKKRPAPTTAERPPRSSADRKSNAGNTPEPWEMCARLEYGGDRSFAWSVREQVIDSGPEDRARIEDQLLKALALPGCTDAGRAFLCQMLALVASVKSVPALAVLLKDGKSADEARYAVQQIAGPEAAAALRDALGSLSGAPKAGVIGSIAHRRDTTARAVLAGIRENPSEAPVVREAAARALAHLS